MKKTKGIWEIRTKVPRCYLVNKTAIRKTYFNEPGAYPTRNAAIRAVLRYRRENFDYKYSHPRSFFKNVKKLAEKAFDEVFNNESWEKYKANHELIIGPQTIKIKKFNIKGLADYKRS